MNLDAAKYEIDLSMYNNEAPAFSDFSFYCTIKQAGSPVTCDVRTNTGELAGFEMEGSDEIVPLVLDGRFCADGTYHFASSVLDDQSNSPQNLVQIALYGRLF